ncbi:MAG: bifunctional DNA-formamidopyrimidine glycosylase/DNA-(apurinic or apyrimidinic site) lyase [Patescibacteria group bacterium]
MPELPEVETIRRQLRAVLRGRTISSVTVRRPKMVRASSALLRKSAVGARIKDVTRRAKLLIIQLSSGWSMLVHLKMTGQLVYRHRSTVRHGGHPISGGLDNLPNRYSHVIFNLSGGATLYFNDQRQFGFLKLVPTRVLPRYLEHQRYGPEPLDPAFTLDRFRAMLGQKRSGTIKPLLMDQRFIAGVGNIYAAEACFRARIRPTRSIRTLSGSEIATLFRAVRHILRRAVAEQGATANNYVDAYGQPGRYVPLLRVYGRGGERCYRCHGTVAVLRQAGRSTAYCPRCQR